MFLSQKQAALFLFFIQKNFDYLHSVMMRYDTNIITSNKNSCAVAHPKIIDN